MKNEKLFQRVEDLMHTAFIRNNKEFFSYAWRENVANFLTNESRFVKLVEWINQRLEFDFDIINTLNPADKDIHYTNGNARTYSDACREVGILLNAKYIILDDNCTTIMRKNWEETICKLFNIQYSKFLNCYENVPKKGGNERNDTISKR